MAVAVSATGTATYNSTATTQNFTFTVNSGDTLVVFWICQDITQTISSVTWDQGGTNQAATLIVSESDPTATNGSIALYGVVNPTAGTKTLRVVNALTTGESAMAQSYTGTVTSSVSSACTNPLVANGHQVAGIIQIGTAAQSGVSGDMYISGYTTIGSMTSVSNTQVYLLAPAGNDASGNRVASTGASVALTCTLPAQVADWASVSCDIVAGGTDILMAQACI